MMFEGATFTTPGYPAITQITFLACCAHYPGGSNRCSCRFLPCPCCLPRSTGGSASTTSLSGPAQASLALRPARLLARPKADFCPEASTRPVARLGRPVATTSYRQLHGWILLPRAICAVGAHRKPKAQENFRTRSYLAPQAL